MLLVTSNLPCFWLYRWAGCGPSDASSQGLLFSPLSTADPKNGGRVRVRGIGGAQKEVEKGMGGGGEWWSGGKTRHTYGKGKKKKSTPSSAPRAPHPNCLIFPPAPLRRVKPPPTGSGSSVPASSGRCSRSSFDGPLTSRQPSGCHPWSSETPHQM